MSASPLASATSPPSTLKPLGSGDSLSSMNGGRGKGESLSVSLVGSRSTSESELTPSPKDAKKGGVNGKAVNNSSSSQHPNGSSSGKVNGKHPNGSAAPVPTGGTSMLRSDGHQPSPKSPSSPNENDPSSSNGKASSGFRLPAAATSLTEPLPLDTRTKSRRSSKSKRSGGGGEPSSLSRQNSGDSSHHGPDGRPASSAPRHPARVPTSRSMPLLGALLRGEGWGAAMAKSDDERSMAEESAVTDTDGAADDYSSSNEE